MLFRYAECYESNRHGPRARTLVTVIFYHLNNTLNVYFFVHRRKSRVRFRICNATYLTSVNCRLLIKLVGWNSPLTAVILLHKTITQIQLRPASLDFFTFLYTSDLSRYVCSRVKSFVFETMAADWQLLALYFLQQDNRAKTSYTLSLWSYLFSPVH